MFSAVGIIPARFASNRLPGKPLVDLQGKPLLYHVYHRASRARSLSSVLIATDDQRIADVARGFGAEVVMTRQDHRSGTDRIAEASKDLRADIVVNIQGDEPLIEASAIDHAVQMLTKDKEADMSTLKAPIEEPDELWNPNIVKVVSDRHDYAVYFSRSPIPYPRVKELPNSALKEVIDSRPELLRQFYRHVGLYAYRRNFLQRFSEWAPTHLELLEDLEQLRAIEHGAKIKIELTHASTFGVDTPEDLDRIRKLISNNPDLFNA